MPIYQAVFFEGHSYPSNSSDHGDAFSAIKYSLPHRVAPGGPFVFSFPMYPIWRPANELEEARLRLRIITLFRHLTDWTRSNHHLRCRAERDFYYVIVKISI